MNEESGRATAPPGVRYNVPSGPSNEGYTHTVASTTSANLAEHIRNASIQSPQYTPSYSNFAQQRPQASPRYTPSYSPCPSPSPNYSVTPKVNSSLPSQSPQYTPSYSSSSHIYSPSFGSSTFSSASASASASSSSSTPTSYNNPNSNFDLPSTSSGSTKSQQSSYLTHENNIFSGSEHISSTLFNIPKSTKTNSSALPRYTTNYSNFSYFSNNQPKYGQSKTNVGSEFSAGDKHQKAKSEFEAPQKLQKACKDETEFNCNIGDLQQFLTKHGSKIKSTAEAAQDSVTDSLLNFLQRKTYEKSIHDNFPYEASDINQVLVSICSKSRGEDASESKKKDGGDDGKSVSDFIPKVFLEREEKRCKNVDERKRSSRKEILDDVSVDCEEKKNKRDAMSHYQEDKGHKRPPGYGDFNQWDYLNPQDIQASSNHGRRGIPFCGSSQSHSMAWNPMGMPHQSNPYYSNPHGHVLPAHAHTEYRYNQWNSPNHKNVTNIQNAHSQNTVLAQAKLDMKHNIAQNSVQDFGLQMNSEYSKMRNSPHDMVLRTPTPDATPRTIHADYSPAIAPNMRNTSNLRTPPPIAGHAKTIISNPLTDLQMLVTNQETDKVQTEKSDVYQQESVDLSAHSENVKQKEADDGDGKSGEGKAATAKDSSSPVSVIQTKSKQGGSESEKPAEKPVELTAKNGGKSDQSGEKEISSTNSSADSVNTGKEEAVAESTTATTTTTPTTPSKTTTTPTKTTTTPTKTTTTPTKTTPTKTTPATATATTTAEDASKEEKTTAEEEEPPKEEKAESEKPQNTRDVAEAPAAADKPESAEGGDCDIAKMLARLDGPEPAAADEGPDEDVNKKSESEVPATSSNEVVDAAKTEEPADKAKTSEEKPEPENNKKILMEVESELQKMFEGVGEENNDLPTVSSTSIDVKPSTSESSKKAPRKRPSRGNRAARLSSGHSSGSENHSQRKRSKISKAGKEESRKRTRRGLYDVDLGRRGPVLHVEGPRDSPASVVVVNFPKGDDEDEKDKNVAKKQVSSVSRSKHHNELDYRGRSKNGLFSSTLSARYDAQTTDYTWICVFCKKGPHHNSLGDLFGPYIISKDESGSLCEFSGDEKDITDAQKRGGRNKRSLRAYSMVDHFQKMSKKLRRCHSGESSCLAGMTVVSDDHVDQLRYEVWVHEQCAVWSPNVCLIGSRIIGMQEAIWTSIRTMCSKCGVMGANIGCVHRNCPNRSHYDCARESGWSLEQETFISTCHVHKPRS